MPQIGLGCMGLGGRYDCDKSADVNAINVIHKAHELGVRMFDTAEVYGAGYGEVLLGKACENKRNEYFISSKFSAENAAYKNVISSCEASLQRLNTDYIDLYQCHWPNPNIPFEKTLDALLELKQQGKIRYAGFSNLTRYQLKSILTLCPSGLDVMSVQQDYSLIDRSVEYNMLPFCQKNNVSLIAYSPLGQGKNKFSTEQFSLLNAIAKKYEVSIQAIMLAWLIKSEKVIAIPMTSNINHLRDNLLALKLKLNNKDADKLSITFPCNIIEINTKNIEVIQSHTGKVFTSLEQAKLNKLNLSPSPLVLAQELKEGELLKPIKVRLKKGSNYEYELYEGQLRFWGWVIAHEHNKPIPAIVEGS